MVWVVLPESIRPNVEAVFLTLISDSIIVAPEGVVNLAHCLEKTAGGGLAGGDTCNVFRVCIGHFN